MWFFSGKLIIFFAQKPQRILENHLEFFFRASNEPLEESVSRVGSSLSGEFHESATEISPWGESPRNICGN